MSSPRHGTRRTAGLQTTRLWNKISRKPHVGTTLFSKQREIFAEPRVALAWSLRPEKTVIRAGLGYTTSCKRFGIPRRSERSYDPTYSDALAGVEVADRSGISRDFKLILVAGGVQPDENADADFLFAPSSAGVSPNTSLTVGYVGSHGYHEIIGVDGMSLFRWFVLHLRARARIPRIFLCPWRVRRFRRAVSIFVPEHRRLIPLSRIRGRGLRGEVSYNALQVDLNKRFSRELALRGVYTWSKVLDEAIRSTRRRRECRAWFRILITRALTGDRARLM